MPYPFRGREFRLQNPTPASSQQPPGEPLGNAPGSTPSELDSTLHLVEELRQYQFELLQQNEELRRTYNELNTATHRYRDLWENAPVGYLTFQRSGVIIQANLRAQRILCGQLAISSGATVQSYLTEESARIFQQHLWNVIGKGGEGAAELQVRSSDASTWILIESSLDEKGEFRSAIIDVSKQRIIETENRILEARLQQSQRLDMLHGLSSGIAHDFNNILQIILAYSELMMNPKMSSEKLNECLNEVLSAAKRGSELTARLLAFSRKSTLQTKVVNLNRILEGVYSVMRRTLSEDIHIQANLSDCPIPVRVDVTLIEQALINLCMNARDALGKGGRIELSSSIGQLPVSLSSGQTDSSKYAIVNVRDDGSGIPPEIIARIFEPFYTTKDVGRGTGLGLAIVSGIIRQHGGNIEVESAVGKGSVFSIYLPFVDEEQESDPGQIVLPKHRLQSNRGKALVVEDELAIRLLVARELTDLGFDVTSAENGQRAIEIIQATPGPFQLLITDAIMPLVNGKDVCIHFRRLHPHACIVVMTGHGEGIINEENLKEFNAKLLTKPFLLGELIEATQDAGLDAGHVGQNQLTLSDAEYAKL